MNVEEFNKRKDVCLVNPYDETELLFNIEDFITAIYNENFYGGEITRKDYERLLEEVSKVPVYEKGTPVITSRMILEYIEDRLTDNYNYSTSVYGKLNEIGIPTGKLEEFLEDFNSSLGFYTTTYKKLGTLDLREEVINMIKEDNDINIIGNEKQLLLDRDILLYYMILILGVLDTSVTAQKVRTLIFKAIDNVGLSKLMEEE